MRSVGDSGEVKGRLARGFWGRGGVEGPESAALFGVTGEDGGEAVVKRMAATASSSSILSSMAGVVTASLSNSCTVDGHWSVGMPPNICSQNSTNVPMIVSGFCSWLQKTASSICRNEWIVSVVFGNCRIRSNVCS